MLSSNPGPADGATSSSRLEITATVAVNIQTRSDSANPPQNQVVTVWTIDKLVSARTLG